MIASDFRGHSGWQECPGLGGRIGRCAQYNGFTQDRAFVLVLYGNRSMFV